MPIDVVLCGDRRVVWGMAASARSALEHARDVINIHVICDGYGAAEKGELTRSWRPHSKCGAIEFVDIASERIAGFRSTMYLKSKATYSRYFIGDLLPTLQRCIYLDIDLLVMRDLAEAARMDLGDAWLAAVRDISVRKRPCQPALRERLGLRDESRYFNGGFLVLDLERWRANDLTQRLVDISNTKSELLHAQDQDALNMVFEDRVLLLDETWNQSQYEKPATLENRIIHMIGPVKPWNARYKEKFADPYYRDVIAREFYAVLDRTAFAGLRPPDMLGLGRFGEYVAAKTPTADMIKRKIRRFVNAGSPALT